MAIPFHPKQFDHLVLRVRDVERAITFYETVLGCTVDRRRPEMGLYHLRCAGFMIDLVDIDGKLGGDGAAVEDGMPRNLDHFCLTVEPFDEAAIRRHLGEHGITASETGERYGARGNGLSMYIRDPDGNQIELKAPSA